VSVQTTYSSLGLVSRVISWRSMSLEMVEQWHWLFGISPSILFITVGLDSVVPARLIMFCQLQNMSHRNRLQRCHLLNKMKVENLVSLNFVFKISHCLKSKIGPISFTFCRFLTILQDVLIACNERECAQLAMCVKRGT
jgi:hypothetical protein